MNQLVVFRALQGIGAGIMQGNSFAIIGDLFPPAQRGKLQGLFGAVFWYRQRDWPHRRRLHHRQPGLALGLLRQPPHRGDRAGRSDHHHAGDPGQQHRPEDRLPGRGNPDGLPGTLTARLHLGRWAVRLGQPAGADGLRPRPGDGCAVSLHPSHGPPRRSCRSTSSPTAFSLSPAL